MCMNLVESAKTGDAAAFAGIVSLHQDRVFALAYRMLGNAEDAADVCQETFLRAWRSLHKFRGESDFSTWLHRITVNLCLSWKQRHQPSGPILFDDNVPSNAPGPAEALENAEDLAELRRALAALPGHYRALIVLRDLEGHEYEEIAEIMGCSPGSARARLCKARAMLRDRLRGRLMEVQE